ncbi:hypothetical protein HF086_006567 [Spodoptera exigua]|uniref:Tudor domain-containing protein n=1 Tax=Spodoptera exigua TaxID=7107 RepID=A0A922MT48_SPOEX|nr:hypothetical protein HF086_006567 [Spodoptera exigua]
MFLGTEEQIKVAKELIENCVAQEKCRREIEQSKRSPRHVQSSSKSPSPTPGVNLNENVDDASGDSQVQRHVKYKRPENRGAPIEVYVSAVSSPSRFWVQFVGPQVTQLDSLVEEMTEYYGKKENRENHAVADVFFLDYGDSEYVATHELCELRADLLRLRFQAMECFLAGVRPSPSSSEVPKDRWHPQAIERFEELTQVCSHVNYTCT